LETDCTALAKCVGNAIPNPQANPQFVWSCYCTYVRDSI
jgi:hypothetical protein